MSAIQRTLKIRPDETALVLSMSALSFVGMAGLAIGQSGANALFFDRIGTDALPLMYLAQGATAFVFMMGLAALLGRVDRRRAYLAIPAGLGAVVLAERIALLTDGRWIFPVLWLTVALAILLQNVFVWGTAGVVTDTRRAKRLFPLFAAGEILGSVAGGLLTNPLVRAIGTENLLLVWAAALAISFALCRTVLSAAGTLAQPRVRKARRRETSPWRDLTVAFGYVRRSRLLVWMTLAAVLFSVLFYSLYLPWATAATERFPDAGDLAGFFGLFWAAMTGAAFIVSVLMTNRLFGRFGIASMMLVLPLLYVGSFGILLVSAGFVTLVILRFVDGVWLQGVASPAWETLTNVVPDARRDQVRTFLNGGPAQAGTAIAGIIALVGQDVLTPRQFAAIGLATAAMAVFVTWRVRASYASALVEALREGRPEVFPDVAVAGVPFAFAPDAQTLGSLLVAMDDGQPPVRRLSVQLLADVLDPRATAALERALRDDDASVRAQALDGLAAAGRAGAETFLPLLHDPDPAVAASAAAAISTGPRTADAARVLLRLAADADPSVRSTALRHLTAVPADAAAGLAAPALDDEDAGVRSAALTTLAAVRPDEALRPAIRGFEDPSPRVREAAVAAAVRLGAGSVDAVLDALARPAARDAALRALARLDLGGRDERVRAFVAERSREATGDDALAAAVPSDGEAAGLLKDALLERARANGRSALRALSLISSDGAAVRSAVESLDAREPGQVANALETLEATTDASLGASVLALWEPTEGARHDPANDWLERASADDDAFVAACAGAVTVRRNGGDGMAGRGTTMPVIERVLFLRRVPLFDGLAPADLGAIAEVAEERSFADRELLASEGELGDELLIVASGTVLVEAGGSEIARRGPGEVVGEMSLITRGPRMASLVADGDVRAIRIGRREFESMIHDRPDIGIGVMRVLAQRLAEARPADPSPASNA